MNQKTLGIKIRLTRLGWCLFVNGEAYAVGTQAYCIAVANCLRRKGGAV